MLSNKVLYIDQSSEFSEAQKAIARTNIDAASISSVNDLANTIINMDSNITASGTNFQLKLVQEDGKITSFTVTLDNTVNATDVNMAIATALADYGGFKVVNIGDDGKPDVSEPSTKIIYLTKDASSQLTDPYTEWIWIAGVPSGTWEVIGEATVDLSDYYTKTESDSRYVQVADWTSADKDIPEVVADVIIGGRKYLTVIIGNQEWLAENLDFKYTGITIGGAASSSSPVANYYDNDEATYGVDGNKYGLLYNEPAAKLLDDNKATIFPSGWRVPTTSDYTTLRSYCGSNRMVYASTTGWKYRNGTNDSGFDAYPTGTRNSSGQFTNVGRNTYFWTTSVDSAHPENADAFCVEEYDAMAAYSPIERQYAIRLVKDLV